VKFRNGPAAVTGDERCIKPLVTDAYREGAVSRMIRESEDLPEHCGDSCEDGGVPDLLFCG